ncbi:hypothetical protein CMALT430_70071 [Carnobacterium maltaromaticum]|uniref:acyl carrier protein n=1 Tax=Carnobacterium maltaromaticum TaxID=2751 RepID=UPI00191BB24F|nr:acyl carrier protein [Carnobacterium maltaromaticum]CAD5901777.1 hypothetical protein CMALT430_70071 [Carnobacterium maltaromaticum]
MNKKNEIEEEIRFIWIKLLSHEEFDLDTPFFSAGGTSIQAVEAHHLINEKYPECIELLDLFELNTIATLSERILERVQGIDTTVDEIIEL